MIRELGFGELHIYVADSQPVRAEEIKKSVKFWPTEQQQVISQHMRYEPAFLRFLGLFHVPLFRYASLGYTRRTIPHVKIYNIKDV